ncbi:hypothetical protein ACQW02_23500 [Humitalea sp. 24SJ18S-53]|uniref:hypothetical protein n=1 Tax=Humitalea sp. 24SJ18S-53 TaxID=3422307 RepID=UPI003D678151
MTITLHSSRAASCGEHYVEAKDPEFAMARMLLDAGHDPLTAVRTVWAGAGMPSLTGVLGRWASVRTKEEDGGSFRLVAQRSGPTRSASPLFEKEGFTAQETVYMKDI